MKFALINGIEKMPIIRNFFSLLRSSFVLCIIIIIIIELPLWLLLSQHL